MTSWQLYWLTRLDSISAAVNVFFVSCVILFLGAFGFYLVRCIDGIFNVDPLGPSQQRIHHLSRTLFVWTTTALVVSVLMSIAVPTTKEVAFIIVAPRLYKAVSENKKLSDIPDKVVSLANDWLDHLKPQNEKEK